MTTTRFVLALAVLAGLGACAAEKRGAEMDGAGAGSTAVMEPALSVAAPPEIADARQMSARDDAAAADRAEQASPQALADSVRPTMLIRNGAARVEVDSLDRAVATVRALATRLDGYVTNVAQQSGRERLREATLTLRLPAARFDEALEGLPPIGRVEAVNVTTEDVGEEYVDVQMRLANARRLEERLLELLGNRTGELSDVLAVERELARVREQIERLEGRLRYLRSRAAMSTLAVTVHEPGPLVASHPGQNVILRALRQSLRNFVFLVAALIESLGVVLPLAALAWVGWLVFRRTRRAPPPARRPADPAGSSAAV